MIGSNRLLSRSMDNLEIDVDNPANDPMNALFVARQQIIYKNKVVHLKFYYNDKNDAFTVRGNILRDCYSIEYKFTDFCQTNKLRTDIAPKIFIQAIRINDVIITDTCVGINFKYSLFTTQFSDSKYEGIFGVSCMKANGSEIVFKKDGFKNFGTYGIDHKEKAIEYEFTVLINDSTIRPILFDGSRIYQTDSIEFTTKHNNSPVDTVIKKLVSLMHYDLIDDGCKILSFIAHYEFSSPSPTIMKLKYIMKIGHEHTIWASYDISNGKFI